MGVAAGRRRRGLLAAMRAQGAVEVRVAVSSAAARDSQNGLAAQSALARPFRKL